MIKIITGKNAAGKTLYLVRAFENRLKSSECNITTNMYDDRTYNEIGYNKYRLNLLREKTLSDDIIVKDDYLTLLNPACDLSKRCMTIITLLCKKVDYIYLDEPEKNLTRHDIEALTSFLQEADYSYKELMIVTHSDVIARIFGAKVYTVEMEEKSSNLKLIPVKRGDLLDIVD